jgi:thiol:disulfide interchange protein DsbD
VALLAYLFFAMGLSLSGLVEIGSGIMGVGGELADRGGYSGSFFTGVLATVVASPCTAPFMGAALGFAVTQPAPIALSVFAALGSGMAAPMLLLSYSTRLRSWMPRPGPWMETFKQVLAFPLYATAIWLLWVSGRQTSVTAMALLLCGMLALALGLWLWRYRGWGKVFATGSVLVAFLVIPSAALEASRGSDTDGVSEGFSQQQLDELLQSGKPVFVNVTADWCITCIANERSALGSAEVEQAMEALGIHYLVVDWTNYDAGIAGFLAQHGRNGVPLYLVYSGRPGEAPQILPQLLTAGIILEAFEQVESK